MNLFGQIENTYFFIDNNVSTLKEDIRHSPPPLPHPIPGAQTVEVVWGIGRRV